MLQTRQEDIGLVSLSMKQAPIVIIAVFSAMNTFAVDWDMFCHEVCKVTLAERSEVLGGEGKTVQIDESKIGKRKYYRRHMVDGQWVFGGIEEEHSPIPSLVLLSLMQILFHEKVSPFIYLAA